ncbi:hypothetical protein N7490_005794 [Penicillium lividum]|nr:hypothetical protein N7490_005794 [Penicillium lividum]
MSGLLKFQTIFSFKNSRSNGHGLSPRLSTPLAGPQIQNNSKSFSLTISNKLTEATSLSLCQSANPALSVMPKDHVLVDQRETASF